MIEQVLHMAGKALREAIQARIRLQGHELTGKIYKEIEERIEKNGDAVTLVGQMVDYARFVEYGVSAERIPYSPGSGAGSSLYIEGLIRYATLRGMDNPKSAAFAIAMKHKKEGMPTQQSRRHSKDGNRTGFLERAIQESSKDIDQIIRAGLGDVMQAQVRQSLEKVQQAWQSV